MSSKSARKISLPKVAATPRSSDEITREYSETVAKAGAHQYQVYVHESELAEVNKRLLSLNNEFAARLDLDKKAKESEVANVQS